MRAKAAVPKKPRDGDFFNPWHRYDIARAIRASPYLSMGAKVTWAALVERTSEQGDQIWPTSRRIAEDIGCSPRQAKRYVSELVKAKLIAVWPTYREKRQTSNRFAFLFKAELVGVTKMSWGG